MKTYSAKPSDVEKKWVVIDASDVVLGRLAGIVAMRLRGKHKAIYTPHIDCGDHVIIINAEKVAVTGNKKKNDIFYWHTGYAGGIKGISKGATLESRFPERLIERAVKRMMPKDSPLARGQMTHLHVFAGSAHEHEAQKPEVLDVAAMNPKNKRK
ncbi:MAG TPA: 50S ribosomal protein L13 [Rhodospirillaceae bacterium]|nr:MAG: 50S ribosomal protein L13 [Alphaproteobacteria bacterium GWF2_58_20]HAU29720.1 50S ribosomal protein L13 [Rhodospirillaceae bacterium]